MTVVQVWVVPMAVNHRLMGVPMDMRLARRIVRAMVVPVVLER